MATKKKSKLSPKNTRRPPAKKAKPTRKANVSSRRTGSDSKSENPFVAAPYVLASGTSKVRNWKSPYGGIAPSAGDFVSRLWTLFGEPTSIDDEGFGYVLRDKRSKKIVTAYSGGSGPAFGAHSTGSSAVALVDELERLVNAARRADCEVVFETEYGTSRVGARKGKAFDDFESDDEE